jgi:hypothetical protein
MQFRESSQAKSKQLIHREKIDDSRLTKVKKVVLLGTPAHEDSVLA